MKKQFETPERCLAEMVEHCWEIYNPIRKCVHCPAKQRLRIQQSEVKEWL